MCTLTRHVCRVCGATLSSPNLCGKTGDECPATGVETGSWQVVNEVPDWCSEAHYNYDHTGDENEAPEPAWSGTAY